MKFFEKAENIFASLMVLIFILLWPPLSQVNAWTASLQGFGLFSMGSIGLMLFELAALCLIIGPALALIAVIMEFMGKEGKKIALIASIVAIVDFALLILSPMIIGMGLSIDWTVVIALLNAIALLLSCLGIIKFKKA